MSVSGKKLMVLGAGVYQVPLIKKAHELGVQVIVVSRAGDYPGFALADTIYELDTTDVEGILAAARTEKIDGITTTGTDVAVPAIGAVCDALGLRGISAAAAARATEKAAMKRALLDGGVSTSPFEEVHSADEALRAAERIGFPVMVKACDVSGSRGITKVVEPEGIADAFEAAMAVTRTDHVIVEGFVSGLDFGFEAFASDGRVELCLTHDKYTRLAGGTTISVGHAFPYRADPSLSDRVLHEVEKIVQATGLDNTAIDGDAILMPDGAISIIEVGGRCGATCIPELISLHTGIDFYAQIVRNALGERPDLAYDATIPSMAKLMFSQSGGKVLAIDEDRIDEICREHDAVVSLDVSVGDEVSPMRNGTNRYGHLIMKTADETYFDEVLHKVEACVHLG